ncbi:glycyl-radical enzyme activating protein [Pseudothermotoga sp. U03pept]|uniref:glycyl-radical enzyme activating protein n=1 Tax=Pseudothermotoga sp. U03pept TaxID=3447012 RepID=UPI003F11314C
MQGLIFNIQRFAIHDGPGIRTTVFLKGCPLSCWWCHNPEGISPNAELMWTKYKCIHCQSCVASCPSHALSFENDLLTLKKDQCVLCGKCTQYCPTDALKVVGQCIEPEDLLRELKKDTMYFDQSDGGVTFSGGEPLLQTEFLLEVLPKIKSHGIHVTIDTSGYVNQEDLEKIATFVDLFLYDLKVIDERKHIKYTGISNGVIKDNLKFLSKRKKEFVIRIPVVPNVNDSQQDLEDLCNFLASLDNKPKIDLLPYHDVSEKYTALWRRYKMNISSDISKIVKYMENELRSKGFQVKIGG